LENAAELDACLRQLPIGHLSCVKLKYRHGFGRRELQIKRFLRVTLMNHENTYLLCVDNGGYPASLERRKIYQRLLDPAAEKVGRVRIVDESGEDSLYPAGSFVPVELSQAARQAFADAG
jgi:hypothetical protein